MVRGWDGSHSLNFVNRHADCFYIFAHFKKYLRFKTTSQQRHNPVIHQLHIIFQPRLPNYHLQVLPLQQALIIFWALRHKSKHYTNVSSVSTSEAITSCYTYLLPLLQPNAKQNCFAKYKTVLQSTEPYYNYNTMFTAVFSMSFWESTRRSPKPTRRGNVCYFFFVSITK